MDNETRMVDSNDVTVGSGRSHALSSSPSLPAEAISTLAASQLPARFGDYVLESEIARGGMGVVYRARQISLNRTVALKMILSGQFASGEDLDRFHVEAEAAASLDHAHIVPIYEIGEHAGHHFFSMKLIDGRSLAHEMPRLRSEPKDGVRLLARVCRAIHYAHQRSVLHRDLKPANILLDARGEPHVSDFGLAKRSDSDSNLTQTGMIVGTPSYMAPEQARPSKEPLTTAADVYSLGAILYEILTGVPPFRGDSPLDTLMMVLNGETPRPRTINPRADRDLETIALKCLEKEAARRYGSAEALAEDLDRWLAGEPILARPIGSVERALKWGKRRPAIAALAAAVLVASLAGVAGIVWQWRQAESARREASQRAESEAQARAAAERSAAAESRARGEEARQRLAAEEAQGLAETQRQRAEQALGAAETNLYFNNVALADREWEAGNIGLADELLDGAPARLRNWEWHHLRRLMHMEDRVLRGHADAGLAVAFTPDGERIVSAGGDRTIRVWSRRTGRAERTVRFAEDLSGDLASVSISADAGTLLVRSQSMDDGRLSLTNSIFDGTTGLRRFTLASGLTSALSIPSPDGRHVASAAMEVPTAAAFAAGAKGLIYRLRLVDAVNGQVIRELATQNVSGHPAYSGDGRRIAYSGGSSVSVLNPADGTRVATLTGDTAVSTLVLTHDGSLLAGGGTAAVTVWDTASGKKLWSAAGDPSRTMAFSPDGRQLAVAGADRTVRLFDAQNGELLARFAGHAADVRSVAFGPDGTIASTGGDRVVRVWRAPAALRRSTISIEGSVYALRAHPASRTLYSESEVAAAFRDLQSGAERLRLPRKQAPSLGGRTDQMFSDDGSRAVVSSSRIVESADGLAVRHEVVIVDLSRGRTLASFYKGPDGPDATPEAIKKARGVVTETTNDLTISPAGDRVGLVTMRMNVVAGGGQSPQFEGSNVDLWDVKTGRSLVKLHLPETMVMAARFTPDGRRAVLTDAPVAKAGNSGRATYTVMDVATGRTLHRLPGPPTSGDFAVPAFSADGAFIAGVTPRNTVTVWDLRSGAQVASLPEHRAAISYVALSPDATRVASVTADGTVKIFDRRSGRPLISLRRSSGPYDVGEWTIAAKGLFGRNRRLQFGPDGSTVVLTSFVQDPKGTRLVVETWSGKTRE